MIDSIYDMEAHFWREIEMFYYPLRNVKMEVIT